MPLHRSIVVGWIVFALLTGLTAVAVPLAAADPEAESEGRTEVRRRGDEIRIFEGVARVPAGTFLDGSVVAIGTDAIIDGRVDEDVVVIFGSLKVSEEAVVEGQVTAVFSDMEIDGFVGEGVVNVGGDLEERGTIDGPVMSLPFGLWGGSDAFARLLFWWRLIETLFSFVVVLLLVALVPERIRRIAEETPVRYVPAFFVGLITYLAALLILTLLLVTLVGLPVGILFFKVLKWLGMAGIFLALGSRIGRSTGREVSVLGGVSIGFALYALFRVVPSFFGVIGFLLASVIGIAFWLFLSVPAVGLIVLTRAGRPARSLDIPPVADVAQEYPQPSAGPVENPPPEAER